MTEKVSQKIRDEESPMVDRTIFREMAEKWPSAIVARVQVEEFSGGAIGEKYLSNLDSLGLGPANRFRVGRKVCYPVTEFVRWLESRATKV